MSFGDDPSRRTISPNRDLDPTRARPQPWFVGGGQGLMIGIVTLVVVLLLARIASTVWMADMAWRWWWAPVPTTLSFDPAKAARPIRPVAPVGNQGDWFPPDSYPPDARRAGEQGRVSVKLLVEPDGYPSACEVIASSGSARLDAATCRYAVRNGRFVPALGPDGQPMRGVFTMRNVVWRLED